MRLLMIHADRFSFEVTGRSKATESTSELSRTEESAHLKDVLVTFVSAEKADESAPRDIAVEAADRIRETAAKVGTDRLMVYPYAHLSSSLARPRIAAEIIDTIVGQLRADRKYETHRAPFGFYKAFNIAGKGHPLSELAMTIVPPEVGEAAKDPSIAESRALAAEKTLESEWRIYQPDGSFVLADEFGFRKDEGLSDLYAYEREGTRIAEEAPPHIRLMREHELVDYESASDAGNLRWYPKGLLVKRLLEQHITRMVLDGCVFLRGVSCRVVSVMR